MFLLTQRRNVSVDGEGSLGSRQLLYLAHSFIHIGLVSVSTLRACLLRLPSVSLHLVGQHDQQSRDEAKDDTEDSIQKDYDGVLAHTLLIDAHLQAHLDLRADQNTK